MTNDRLCMTDGRTDMMFELVMWIFSLIVSLKISGLKGFPHLQVAMISELGIIKSFSIDGPKYETFPNLQRRKFDQYQKFDFNHL